MIGKCSRIWKRRWTRLLYDNFLIIYFFSSQLILLGCRHPVVEEFHAQIGRQFVKNDCNLNPGRHFWFITGPNMGGKSTFLRQSAIAVILAQAGSFVPADSMSLGIVDAIFTRVFNI